MLRNLIVLCLSFYSVTTFASIQILRIEYAPNFHVKTGYPPSHDNTAIKTDATDTVASTKDMITINNPPISNHAISSTKRAIPALKAPEPASPHLPETPPVDEKFIYAIKYNESSPVKNVPLENSNLKIQVYYNGNPEGFEVVKTDANKNFDFDRYPDTQSITMEVLAVENQEQYHAYCTGNMNAEGSHEIIITCKPTS